MSLNSDRLLGRIIGGYRLESILGKGGSSTVFLCQRVAPPHDQVAMKVLMPPPQMSLAEIKEIRTRFSREALMLGHKLQHPHILPVLEAGEDDLSEYAYIITPYIRGGTLARRIISDRIPIPEALTYLRQIADALDYAHSQQVIHRDLKPANILLSENRHCYLADFGIIKLLDTAHTTLTEMGRIIGTPEYMSPEQAQGETVTVATDIYSLGVLAYQLITGHLPYQPATVARMLVQVLSAPPIPPRSFRPELPEQAEASLLKALSKNPTARFKTATQFIEVLSMGLQGKLHPVLLDEPILPMEGASPSPLATPTLLTSGTLETPPIGHPRRRPFSLLRLSVTILLTSILIVVSIFASDMLSSRSYPDRVFQHSLTKGYDPTSTTVNQIEASQSVTPKTAQTPNMGTLQPTPTQRSSVTKTPIAQPTSTLSTAVSSQRTPLSTPFSTVDPSLKAEWTFDEGHGTIANDASNFNHTLFLHSDASWTTNSHQGPTALNLVGTVNSYAETDGPILDTTQNYTVSAWVKLYDTNTWYTAVAMDTNYGSAFYLQYCIACHSFSFTVPQEDKMDEKSTLAVATIGEPSLGVWYHLTGVCDVSNQQIRLYVNGKLQSSQPQLSVARAIGHTTIGRAHFNGGNVDFWRGMVDDVRIYDRVLSDEEIQRIATT